MNRSKVVLFFLSLAVFLNMTACTSVKLDKNGGFGTDTNKEANSENYVGTVAGEKITVPEYKFMLTYEQKQMLADAGIDSTNSETKEIFWNTINDGQDKKLIAKENALDRLKELKIVLIKAKEENLQLDENELSEVKLFIEDFIAMEGEGDKAKAEQRCVEAFGVNLADLEEIYKEYYLVGKFATETAKRIEIKEEDLKDYYEKNSIERVTVKHVLILTQDESGKPLSGEEKAKKKELADDILKRAKSGEDFVSLVSEFSEDPGSNTDGGEYTFGRGQMVKEFEDWSFSAKEGDLGIVETEYGYHVMKFIKKVGFEDERDSVKAYMQTEEYTKMLEEWKADKKYEVKINQKVLDSNTVF